MSFFVCFIVQLIVLVVGRTYQKMTDICYLLLLYDLLLVLLLLL